MKTDTPVTIRRTDYAPPAFLVDTVDLDFDLDPAATTVRARLALRRNPAAAADAPLHLDGDGLTLVEAKLDGAVLAPERLAFAADGSLSIAGLPDAVGAGDGGAHRAGGEHLALRPLHLGRQFLHPMRGRGLPPHHLSSPTGPT